MTMAMQEDMATSDAGQAPRGLDRLGRSRPTIVAQPGGTLALRANDITCRALEDTETFAAFALWIGPGM